MVVNMASTMGVGMATTYNGALLLVVSVLQGAAFSVMVFTARQNKAFDKQTVGGGGIAMIAAGTAWAASRAGRHSSCQS